MFRKKESQLSIFVIFVCLKNTTQTDKDFVLRTPSAAMTESNEFGKKEVEVITFTVDDTIND